MKPGCFLKSIIILTILVAAIMYIIQHKSEVLFEPGKKIVAGFLIKDWNKNLVFVKNTPEKKKLKEKLESYIKDLKFRDVPEDKDINNIVEMIKSAVKDSIITSDELKEISNQLKIKDK